MTKNEKVAEARRLLTDAPRSVANWLRLMALRQDQQAADVIDATIKSVYYWCDITQRADWEAEDVVQVKSTKTFVQVIGDVIHHDYQYSVFEVVLQGDVYIPSYDDQTSQHSLKELVDMTVEMLASGDISSWEDASTAMRAQTSGLIYLYKNGYRDPVREFVEFVDFIEETGAPGGNLIRRVEGRETWAWANREARLRG